MILQNIKYKYITICQTQIKGYYYSTLAIRNSMLRSKEKSSTVLLCPPCTNNSSGGPSWISLASVPHLLISQILILLSLLLLPKMAVLKGLNSTLMTSSVWFSNEWTLVFMFLRSQSLTVLSPPPVMRSLSSKGQISTEQILLSCPYTLSYNLYFYLRSQTIIHLSSETLTNLHCEFLKNQTSLHSALCSYNVSTGKTVWLSVLAY